MKKISCRHCNSSLTNIFCDLNFAPPSNSFLSENKLQSPETSYPLKVFVCSKCFLVQTQDFAAKEIFFSSDYVYFSSFSKSWLSHCQKYVSEIITLLSLKNTSNVCEVASNDGYLLSFFKEKNI